MRLLIISDIHGNLEALQAVLREAQGRYDRCFCLGDVVGYGADPQACAALVRDVAAVVIRGNHDRACVAPESALDFNPIARLAVEWTHNQLDAPTRAWLESLPAGPVLSDGIQLAHGSPLDEDEYITSTAQAAVLLAGAGEPLTCIGHTHLQGGWRMRGERTEAVARNGALPLDPGQRYLLNPGSVGQPRDGDWRAAYMICDGGNAEFCRADYDLAGAQGKILRAGLPPTLAERLAAGW